MKAKHIPLVLALLGAVIPAACTHPVVNMNAPQMAENQSRIYTLFVNARPNERNLVEGSIKAYIVIDGAEHEMTLAPFGDEVYQYEYRMPADRAEAKYYFVIRYDAMVSTVVTHREWKSPETYTLNIVNRYVLQLEVTRGVVGATIPVVGRGFLPVDFIVIGGVAAPTKVASPNAMTFQVPPLAPGDYPVEWHSGADVFQVGAFHVDISNFKVTPASLEVASTEATTLTISMDQPAPDGGLPVNVLTDAPASVIMEEVRIPAGQTSVDVKIKGGQPGAGNLRINTPGFNTITIPIKVGEAPPPPVAPITPEPVVTPVEPLPPVTTPAPVPEPAPVIRGS
ncbi:MAG TPA: cell surface protein [Opitutales bacterium]|nr:cell surface protein [Opitutales bacterium]